MNIFSTVSTTQEPLYEIPLQESWASVLALAIAGAILSVIFVVLLFKTKPDLPVTMIYVAIIAVSAMFTFPLFTGGDEGRGGVPLDSRIESKTGISATQAEKVASALKDSPDGTQVVVNENEKDSLTFILDRSNNKVKVFSTVGSVSVVPAPVTPAPVPEDTTPEPVAPTPTVTEAPDLVEQPSVIVID